MQIVDKLNKQKIDDGVAKIKNKCKEVNAEYEKCKIIQDRLYAVFENKQKLYLDNLREEIREKNQQKKL